MHIGRNVSKLRDLKGLKQDEFAQLLGISQQAVSRLENKLENKKEIDDDMLHKIAEKLDVTLEGIKQFSPDRLSTLLIREENMFMSTNYICIR